MTRPAYHVDVATTALPAAIAQPPGGIQTAGFPAHSKFASAWANWLFNYLGDWSRELDQSALRVGDMLSIATPQLLQGSGTGFLLQLVAGLNNLTAVRGGAYVLFGRRVDLSVDAINAKYPSGFTLTPSTTNYVHAREELGFGGSSTGEILISVNPVEVGYQTIWSGVTNATDLVSQMSLADSALQWLLPIESTGHLYIDDPEDEIALSVTAANTLVPAVLVTSLGGAVAIQSNIGNTTGIAYGCSVGTGAGVGFEVSLASTPNGGAGVLAIADNATAAPAIWAQHAGSGIGMRVDHTGNGAALAVTHTGLAATATTIIASGNNARGLFVAGSGSGSGMLVQSGATAGANGVQVSGLLNNTGFGVVATTSAAATSVSRGGKFTALASATGVEGVAVDGAGVRASASGGGVGLFLPGKASDPVDINGGGLDYNTTTKTLVTADSVGLQYRDVWTSRGGNVVGETSSNLKTTNGAIIWQVAATLALTGANAPRRAGRFLLLQFRCDARNSLAVADNYLNVRIIDTTAAVTLVTRTGAGSTTGSGYRMSDGTSADWQRAVVLDVHYLIPAAGDRTFTVEISTVGIGGKEVLIRDASLIPYGLV